MTSNLYPNALDAYRCIYSPQLCLCRFAVLENRNDIDFDLIIDCREVDGQVFFDECPHVFSKVDTQTPQDTVALDFHVFIPKQCQNQMMNTNFC